VGRLGHPAVLHMELGVFVHLARLLDIIMVFPVYTTCRIRPNERTISASTVSVHVGIVNAQFFFGECSIFRG
jgi:hypothetical protein